jgi:hypothetical protein
MIGWQDGELVRFDINNLKKAVEIVQNDSSEPAKDSGPVNLTGGWSFVLERYSLSYNMFISLGKALRARLFGKWENPSRGENVYCLQTLGKYNFKDMFFNNPYTRRNLEAISRWFDDSRKHNYKLVFILIPPDDYGDERYYSPLKAYLRDFGIEYVDLAHEFAVKQKAASKLYWTINRHLNEAGNYILGELLAERFR